MSTRTHAEITKEIEQHREALRNLQREYFLVGTWERNYKATRWGETRYIEWNPYGIRIVDAKGGFIKGFTTHSGDPDMKARQALRGWEIARI
ncbi:hypothetical protein [Geotalea sp. SG265]|uniref:hypothetical protein n=1 Tax=Geotalea sp. SG265 TaxID=2922867 RepID=UPI001FAF5246|nr:hypothetical protein [Geotalea sp. SG265]